MLRLLCSRLLLIASTSEVYGLSTDVPFREDGNLVMGATTKGRWSYACSKAIDEFLALAYWREKKLPTIVVRLFNTVGPRQTGQYGMVIPTFVKQALAGRPITVYGDGKQVKRVDKPLPKGDVLTIGGDAKDNNAWFLTVRPVNSETKSAVPAKPEPVIAKPAPAKSAPAK